METLEYLFLTISFVAGLSLLFVVFCFIGLLVEHFYFVINKSLKRSRRPMARRRKNYY